MDKRNRINKSSERLERTLTDIDRRERSREISQTRGNVRKKTISQRPSMDAEYAKTRDDSPKRTQKKRKRAAGNRKIDDQRVRRISSGRSSDLKEHAPGRKNIDHRKKKTRRRKRKQRWNRKLIARIIQIILILVLAAGLFYVITNYSEANKLNTKGLEAYHSADYELANDYFKRAIEKDGSNYEYHMNQAMALSELKMYNDAMPSFDKALEAAKSSEEKQLVQRSKGISLLYQGNYDEALEAFDAALDGKDSHYSEIDMDILYYKAETLDKAGRYVDAVIVYTQIVDEEPSADAYMLRGMEYVKVGDYPSAESDLRMAIKKEKKNYDIYFALHHALVSQNRYDEAASVLEEALKLGGSKADALVNQGRILMELGDFATAEEKLQKALNKGADRANLVLAQLYMEKPTPDPTAAVGYFESYFTAVTDDAEAYNLYGMYLMEIEDYTKAEEVFTKGVALGDRLMDRSLSKNQISAAEHAGHWENALEYVEVYLQKYADDEAAIKEKEFIQTRIR